MCCAVAIAATGVTGFCLMSLETLSREDLLVLIAMQQRTIDELKSANEQLRARVEKLESEAGRNSENSSMPPSSDGSNRAERSKVPSAGRPRGKQPGAPGTGLALVADPGEVLDVFPPSCAGCGSHMVGGASVGFARRQCHDIAPVSVVVTETRWHQVRCGCGRITAAAIPDEVPDAPVYGTQLQALAVYLLVYQHIPVERAAKRIRDVTGAAVSTGWVSSLLPKAATLLVPPLKLIAALLVLGHVLHAGETTTNVAGKRCRLHVACTDSLSLLTLGPRSKAGAARAGVLTGFTGTMVHDALWLYNGFPRASHQLCCAHVMRELTACDQRWPGEIWGPQIRWAIAEMIKAAAAARAEGLDRSRPRSCAAG